MRKAFISIAILSMLTGCYKDKGNYDYHLDEMNEIQSFSFSPEPVTTIAGKTIELQQPLNEEEATGHIEVKLEQTLSDNIDQVDFFWYLSHKEGDKEIKDTVRTKGYLDVPLAIGKETKYSVLLEVKDNSTTLSKYEKIMVQTRPIFKNSLFVLHGQQGNALLGNVETIGKETKVRTNAFAVTHPDASDNPFRHAAGLITTAYMNNSTQATVRLAVLNRDGSSKVYDPYGLKEVLWNNYALPTNTGNARPFTCLSHFAVGTSGSEAVYRCVLSTDGRFYWSRNMLAFKVPGETSTNPNHLKDYQVTAGTFSNSYILLWDQKHNRFICVSNQEDYFNYYDEKKAGDPNFKLYNPVVDAHVDLSELKAQGLSPEGKEAVYAYVQYKTNFEESHPFFIFKDKQSDQYYLYELTALGNDKDDKGGRGKQTTRLGKEPKEDSKDNEPLFSITGKRLNDFHPNQGVYTILYSTEYISSYVFYADGANLYRFNTSNGDKTLLYQAPEGWNIQILKLRSYDTNFFMGEDDDNLRQYICIGMNKGTEGAVAEVKLTTSGDVDETFPTTVYTQDAEGHKFGNILDLQFAYEYMYHIKEYE